MNATARFIGNPGDDQVDADLTQPDALPPPPRIEPSEPTVSLATDTNTGGLVVSIAQRFASADEARMRELDAAIAAGKGNETPHHRPGTALPGPSSQRGDDGHLLPVPPPHGHSAEGGNSLNPKPEEEPMRARKCCGSTSREHADGCEQAKPSASKPAAKARSGRGKFLSEELIDLSVDDLVEFREAVTTELRRRRDEASMALRAIEKVLEDAV